MRSPAHRRPTRMTARTRRGSGVAASSWTAILAATTLGVDGSTLRAQVQADGEFIDDGQEYSLVVQSYDGDLSSWQGGRPVGSIQRVVSGAELRRGVNVSLLELREVTQEAPPDALIVAWIEPDNASLDYDAREARPPVGSAFGTVRREAGDQLVHLSLGRKAAA